MILHSTEPLHEYIQGVLEARSRPLLNVSVSLDRKLNKSSFEFMNNPLSIKVFGMPKINNFSIQLSEPIEELGCHLTVMQHKPTRARLLHLANDDEENAFNLSFQTTPETSNGVAHILEHTVLCGSKKFPIRDPFFGMTRRSLNTFMNAFTGADFTCYPAATQIKKDFYNLLDVYADAVFHPQLDFESFLQEGHRLELEKDHLAFKGIVFNEMKGALATGEARLGEALMHALFPNVTYGVNSGGDPAEIPNLGYDELLAFHRKFYHPSRCLFYFYGNIPLESHLEFLENNILKDVTPLPPLPPIPLQTRFREKKSVTLSYPIAPHEERDDKTLVGISWLTCTIEEQQELLALNVIDIVLMGTDGAPLKMALLRSGLCKQTDSSLESDTKEIPYTLYCKGCAEKGASQIEAVIDTTLREVEFPTELVEGAIHQLEMARTEIGGGSLPYGLQLFFRSGLLQQHGVKPDLGLKVHSLFKALRANVQDPSYLKNIVQKHLIDNPHKVVIEMAPDQNLAEVEEAIERKKLHKLEVQLDTSMKQTLITQAETLEALQESEENVDLLPKVTLEDIPHKGKEFVLSSLQNVYFHDGFTNELIYADVALPLPQLTVDELPYARLFALFAGQVGCGTRHYGQQLDTLMEHTGGLGFSLDLCPQASDPEVLNPLLLLRGKALYRKQDHFFPLMREMLTELNFQDKERIQELVMQHVSGMESSLHHSALRYAMNLAAAAFSPASIILNKWYGLDYYWKLKEIAKDIDALIDQLEKMQHKLLHGNNVELLLSCDRENIEQLQHKRFFEVTELPKRDYQPWCTPTFSEEVESQGRIIASPVAFTTCLFPALPYTHPDAPALQVASEIMENQTLHKRIREQGGAYGAGAALSLSSAQFYLYSYRDPELQATLDAFEEAITSVAEGKCGAREIEEAKLGIFQDLDAPVTPAAQAAVPYFRKRGGRDPEVRQQYREGLMHVGHADVQRSAATHLLSGIKKGVVVSFAGKEFFDQHNPPFPLLPL